MMMKIFVLVLISLSCVRSDVYLHNPRGSNNRLNTASRDTSNQNRLFNSQNNARGGYNVGNLYYYQDTELDIEWSNQHSCGHENNNCELVLQYMCGYDVRDGVTRSTPLEGNVCKTRNCNKYYEHGMHEDYDYYLRCRNRARNTGLFTADQNLKGTDARFTRQNANGARRGYECPEERDYYPYWHPTPWKDIVVMTNDVSRCDYYEKESENVKGRGHCVYDDDFLLTHSSNGRFPDLPNNKEDCENHSYEDRTTPKPWTVYTPKWVEVNSHGISAPDCIKSPWSRDNHHGNGIGGFLNKYKWKVPFVGGNHKCVIRLRYNISSNDYNSWSTTSKQNTDLTLPYFENEAEASERGYVYKNNPSVKIFPGLNLELNLAMNTAQLGRTFQDRSHTYTVKKRYNSIKSAIVHNVNVRGKRGNLQQVYPATEYDFVPNDLKVKVGDYVHFQWTGSNLNPGNNAGNGRAGTDRSNVVLLDSIPFGNGSDTRSDWGRNYPAHLRNSSFLGFSFWDRKNLASLMTVQCGGNNMPQLDEAGTYFDLTPRKVTAAGVYNYMSTRNNAFTNRCQKARIIAEE